jgi:hypothetical protein
VEGVGGEDDPAAERDLVAGESVGIPAAVVVLVRVADELGGRHQLRDRLQDALAGDGVLLDLGPLVVVEGAGLLEDFARDGDLPDVVEPGRDEDVLADLAVHRELVADLVDDELDVVRVLPGRRVRGLEHGRRDARARLADAGGPVVRGLRLGVRCVGAVVGRSLARRRRRLLVGGRPSPLDLLSGWGHAGVRGSTGSSAKFGRSFSVHALDHHDESGRRSGRGRSGGRSAALDAR